MAAANSWRVTAWLLSESADAKSRPGAASASFGVMTPSLFVSNDSKLSSATCVSVPWPGRGLVFDAPAAPDGLVLCAPDD